MYADLIYKLKRHHRLWIILLFPIFLLSTLVLLESSQSDVSSTKSDKGQLYLEQHQFNQHSPINLDGDWDFYWNKLVTPEEIKNQSHSPDLNIEVPGLWQAYEINGKQLSNEGHATYSILIHGLLPGEYGLIIPTTYTANKIWLNQKLVAQSGEVGSNSKQTSTRWRSHDIFFSSIGKPIRLTVQMATYNHPNFDGGITRAITLGTADQIHYLSLQRSLIDWLTVGIFLILALYQFIVYWQNKSTLVPLYFSLVSILIVLGALLTRNSFLHLNIFELDFSLYQRLIYLCQSFIAILFLKYIQGFYPRYCNVKIVNFLLYLSVIYFILMQILTPYEPYVSRNIFNCIMVVTISYGLVAVFRAALNKEKSAEVFFLGILFVTLSFVYESLIANDILHPLNTSKDGPATAALFIFVLTQTFILARRHTDTIVESLSYKQANLEKNRFISAASHDLRQPLYTLQLLSDLLSNKSPTTDISKVISSINNSTKHMEVLINSILDISKIDQFGVQPKLEVCSINQLFVSLKNKFQYEAEEKNLKLKIVDTQLCVFSDYQLLERIVSNLVSNAIRYTSAGTILLGCRRIGSSVQIQVYDTGPGIPEDQQHAIFQEFYQIKNDKSSKQGFGLGLSIVKRLADALNHKISINSKLNSGTLFSVQISRA